MYTLYGVDEYGSDFAVGEFANVQEAREQIEEALEYATGKKEIANLKSLLLQIEWDWQEWDE
jgi:hypothetical protein